MFASALGVGVLLRPPWPQADALAWHFAGRVWAPGWA
jgi:hypothetical protein